MKQLSEILTTLLMCSVMLPAGCSGYSRKPNRSPK